MINLFHINKQNRIYCEEIDRKTMIEVSLFQFQQDIWIIFECNQVWLRSIFPLALFSIMSLKD